MIALRALPVVLLALAGAFAWPRGPADLGFRPDFLLLAALGAGLFGPGDTGAWTGIAAGLLAGPGTLEPFGFDAALLGAAGMLATKVRYWFRADHAAVQGVMAGATALLLGLLRLARLEASGGSPDVLGTLPAVLAGAAATAAAAPLVLFVLDALRVFRGPRKPEGRPRLV